MSTGYIAVAALAATLVIGPAAGARAHSAGILDSHGCHTDRRSGAYHCHRGDYAGMHFRSKSDMLEKKAQGYTGQDQVGAKAPRMGGLSAWWPFGRSRAKSAPAESGGNATAVIIPKGLEKRLAVLKELHDKQLITDEEYAAKKQDILGEL